MKAIAEEKQKSEEKAANVLAAAKKKMTQISKEADLAAEVRDFGKMLSSTI